LKLTSLKDLYLHGNEALGLPVEVLGATPGSWYQRKAATPSKILRYYFRVLEGHSPLNEAKLVLVGRGGVGKTSIVNRLVFDRFEKDEKKTEGISIIDWSLLLNDKENVQLNVWDFGGQEIMHATHQFFLTQRSLYLLVLNGREGAEDTDAEYWLKLIESFGGDSPVIVIMNKIKEHAFDLNRRALQQKYPAIRHFVKTDCEDGTGINELAKLIEGETDRLDHLRDAFPASWFKIKDELSGMKRNYLPFEEYCQICQEHGETDRSAQEELAGHLHDLGIILNYKDDPRLQDTHVLSPHWVTSCIYRILNSSKLEAQHGEIRIEDLVEILDTDLYPVSMQRFILDLMKKFELCLSFPDDDRHFLIPELLDKQEPEAVVKYIPEHCLNFQYHYPVLLEGLLPRFIVRTHVLSQEGMPRWRTGVILRFEKNFALVKADVHDKKVFISVAGPIPGRRTMLAIIRSDFELIHSNIPNLQPEEMVPLLQYHDVVVPYKKLLAMERAGEKSFPEFANDEVINVDVAELLDGVDLEDTRRNEKNSMDRQPLRLFYSYSHKDEHLRNELETHLKLLQRQGVIETWHDRKLEAGDDWKLKIDENLDRADLILLLVSANFIASDYCYKKEMTLALERHQTKRTRVIPVIIRDVDWSNAPFANLQALPDNGKAVTKWKDKDSAWRNVSEGIKKLANETSKR
jgi:internalin A